jgi:hypothetical protein
MGKQGKKLIVLSPRVVAFRTPEEPHLAFICSPQLPEPPEGKIVLAFRAFYLDGGHGVDLMILIVNYGDLIGSSRFHGLLLVLGSKTLGKTFDFYIQTRLEVHACSVINGRFRQL